MKITLPNKHKKDILAFCKEFEFLAYPRKIRITVPSFEAVVKVSWMEDYSVSILEEREIYSDPYKSKEIKKINEQIKDFIKRTGQWGRKNFKEKEWIWNNVLWSYNAEDGQTVDVLEITWE